MNALLLQVGHRKCTQNKKEDLNLITMGTKFKTDLFGQTIKARMRALMHPMIVIRITMIPITCMAMIVEPTVDVAIALCTHINVKFGSNRFRAHSEFVL